MELMHESVVRFGRVVAGEVVNVIRVDNSVARHNRAQSPHL